MTMWVRRTDAGCDGLTLDGLTLCVRRKTNPRRPGEGRGPVGMPSTQLDSGLRRNDDEGAPE